MQLLNEETGAIGRKATGWEEQYRNLRTRGHNFLRITRILKCLGEFNHAHYQAPWCEHFIREVFEERVLEGCANSLVGYWIPVVKDDSARQRLEDNVSQYMDK